jgi:hypothetical protein
MISALVRLTGKRGPGLFSAVGAFCAAAILTLAACGGGDDKKSGEGDTSSTPAGEVTTIGSFADGGTDTDPEGDLEAKVSGGQPQKESLQVAPDARVSVRANISNAGDKPTVRLVIPKGPGVELPVEFGGLEGDPVATLPLKSTGGPVKVGQIRYICSLPPRTFCPVQIAESKDSYELRMVPGEDGRVQVRLSLRPEAAKKKGTKPAGKGEGST